MYYTLKESLLIYPAYLPLKERDSDDAFHSGWSRPIPYHIFRNWSIGYTEIYDEFFKQVHYKMEVLDRCRDSNLLEDTFLTAQFRTNTYSPPGQHLENRQDFHLSLICRGNVCTCNSQPIMLLFWWLLVTPNDEVILFIIPTSPLHTFIFPGIGWKIHHFPLLFTVF